LGWYDRPIVATIGCMQERKRELEKLIQKYSSGQLTDLERGHLTKWLQELDVTKGDSFELEGASRQMKEKIDARLLSTETTVKIQHPSWLFLCKIAAFVLFCFSFSWFLLEGNSTGESEQKGSVSVAKSLPKSIKKTCTVVQDSMILLEDGSKVRLLANSTMSWPQPFPKEQRAIQLQGKAFFEVAHDKTRPFTVLASNILTTALGTSFWVTQDTKNAKPRVRLITGRVSIKERGKDGKERLLAYLTPGQTWKERPVDLKKEQLSAAEKPVEMAVPIALVFHHRPLTEVLPAIASFYQTTIVFTADEVSGLSLYGTYTHENDVAQILQTICLANDLELKFNSETNTYTIVKNSQ